MAPSKKTKTKKQQNAKIGVLIEFKVPKTSGMMAMEAENAANSLAEKLGISIDKGFTPVTVNPSNTQREIMLKNNEDNQHMLVRAEVSSGDIDKIKKNKDVVEVWTDAPIEPFACPIPPCDCSPNVPKGNIADVANYLGVNQIWSLGKRGDGIVVGVVDGGITATGRTLAPGEAPARTIDNVIGGWPTADWGTKGASWGYHGNMCATDVLGMAPNSKIFDLRISSANTAGTISNAISAYDWAIAQHRSNGTPHILTNSWGIFQESWAVDYATNPNHPFTRKVIEAMDEGIIILFAAGNCGDTCADGRCSTDKGPGRSIWGANGHPRVMTVGAVNKNEQFVGYSSQGPAALDPHKPDFCSITHFTGYFNSDSGTSAATPICAGLVALIKQGKANASQASIKQALIDTCKNIGPAGWDQHSGAGIIQGKAAYDRVVGTIKVKDLKDIRKETVKELKEGSKELKDRRKDFKELKHEKNERKELKVEKIEIKEKSEKERYENFPGRDEMMTGGVNLSVEQRLANIEDILTSFIGIELRPDLSAGALTNETDYGMENEVYNAQLRKLEADNTQY
jgi:subtilisin family serine protease